MGKKNMGLDGGKRKRIKIALVVLREIAISIMFIGVFIFLMFVELIHVGEISPVKTDTENMLCFIRALVISFGVIGLSIGVVVMKSPAGLVSGIMLGAFFAYVWLPGAQIDFHPLKSMKEMLIAAYIGGALICCVICIIGLIRVIKEWRAKKRVEDSLSY